MNQLNLWGGFNIPLNKLLPFASCYTRGAAQHCCNTPISTAGIVKTAPRLFVDNMNGKHWYSSTKKLSIGEHTPKLACATHPPLDVSKDEVSIPSSRSRGLAGGVCAESVSNFSLASAKHTKR